MAWLGGKFHASAVFDTLWYSGRGLLGIGKGCVLQDFVQLRRQLPIAD